MALDVHIIAPDKSEPDLNSYTSFGFDDEHEGVFRFAFNAASSFPQLGRMRDFYDDVIYRGEELDQLIRELDRVLLQFEGCSLDARALTRFRELAQQAAASKKAILLFAD